jgi:hypothetical protein
LGKLVGELVRAITKKTYSSWCSIPTVKARAYPKPLEIACPTDNRICPGAPLALEERGDPPVAIGWPLVDEATDIGGQFDIAGPDLWQRPQLPHR